MSFLVLFVGVVGGAVAKNVLAAIDGRKLEAFEYRPMGFSGVAASLFWRATHLFKLQSPKNRTRIAPDWLLDPLAHPSVTRIRGRGS